MPAARTIDALYELVISAKRASYAHHSCNNEGPGQSRAAELPSTDEAACTSLKLGKVCQRPLEFFKGGHVISYKHHASADNGCDGQSGILPDAAARGGGPEDACSLKDV
jgi:hypothetical protein